MKSANGQASPAKSSSLFSASEWGLLAPGGDDWLGRCATAAKSWPPSIGDQVRWIDLEADAGESLDDDVARGGALLRSAEVDGIAEVGWHHHAEPEAGFSSLVISGYARQVNQKKLAAAAVLKWEQAPQEIGRARSRSACFGSAGTKPEPGM